MSWTPEQLLKHEKVNSLLGVNIKPEPPAPVKSAPPQVIEPEGGETGLITFTVIGEPMGKPRMTQRDRWKKRPVVERYHDYCDRIKEAAPNKTLTADVYGISVKAYITMPKSWPKKKRLALDGKMCRSKPDWDNIGKAVCDALFKEDSMIADGRTRKFWCWDGHARTEVELWYHANPQEPEKSVLSK